MKAVPPIVCWRPRRRNHESGRNSSAWPRRAFPDRPLERPKAKPDAAADQETDAREFMLIDVVVLSILIYALLGKLADSASRFLERLTLSWHPAFQKH
jgi:hypothetical protein